MSNPRDRLRQSLYAKRQTLPQALAMQYAIDASNLLFAHPVFQQSQHVACYQAASHEISCAPIIKKLFALNKRCYLPRIDPEKKGFMHFAPYAIDDPLAKNRYGILEPINPEVVSPTQLDLIIMPLVGFDRQGNRLGSGAGYYDRALAGISHGHPILLGLAYCCQENDQLKPAPWDIAMDGFVTEKEMVIFRSQDIL